MPLFGKPHKPPHTSVQELPDTPPPAPAPDPAPEAAPEAAPAPRQDDARKGGLFARFRRAAPPPPDDAGSPLEDLAVSLSELAADAPAPPDPDKAARRAARRAQRQAREDEWNETLRQRRNDAALTGLPMQPLSPLPPFTSDSEDERPAPSEHVVAEGMSALAAAPHAAAGDAADAAAGAPTDAGPGAAADAAPGAAPGQPAPPPLPQAAAPARDPRNDVRLAEMFGAQAFVGTASFSAPLPMTPPAPPPAPLYTHPPPPHQPAPIGWGGVYDSSVPSQPMYGAPAHLAARGPPEIDPVLADKIRRGRELAMLAIEQEEHGNLGAAEAGYMKALTLLVPASKDLDVGSELNKNARMKQKAKIQREATAMMDRCEELRLFLKANGPAVPKELPNLPPSQPSLRSVSSFGRSNRSLGAPPTRDLPPPPPALDDSGRPPHRLPSPPPPANGSAAHHLPPPPAPPAPAKHQGELFQRIANRKNVLSSASTVMPESLRRPSPPREHPPAAELPAAETRRRSASAAKCFMCSAPAHLRTPCDHAFCSNCGNQAVSVFGQCPVPGCGQPISVESFEHIL